MPKYEKNKLNYAALKWFLTHAKWGNAQMGKWEHICQISCDIVKTELMCQCLSVFSNNKQQQQQNRADRRGDCPPSHP